MFIDKLFFLKDENWLSRKRKNKTKKGMWHLLQLPNIHKNPVSKVHQLWSRNIYIDWMGIWLIQCSFSDFAVNGNSGPITEPLSHRFSLDPWIPSQSYGLMRISLLANLEINLSWTHFAWVGMSWLLYSYSISIHLKVKSSFSISIHLQKCHFKESYSHVKNKKWLSFGVVLFYILP